MSEETFRLSHIGSDEQNGGQEEVHELRDDLKARTSELQLRRPSRRELRLQREANEAKAAAQSEKRAAQPDTSAVTAPPERQSSGRVHTFSLSSLERNTLLEKLEEEKSPGVAPTPQVTPQSESAGATSTVSEPAKEKEPEDAPASSGRSSLFDRFGEKNKDSVSFRDRLVARTREAQLETHEEQPALPVESHDEPNEQADDATRVIETVSDKTDARPNLSAGDSRSWPSLEVEDKASETPAKEDTRVPEEDMKTEVAAAEEPQPESDDKPQATDEADKKTDSAEVKDSASEATSSDSSADSSEESNEVTAVVEAGRYPTDVTMRIGDDDEEKTTKDRLISALIILVGVLIGVILGLIVQKLIFGAEGSSVEPVETVQAYVLDYEVDAGL